MEITREQFIKHLLIEIVGLILVAIASECSSSARHGEEFDRGKRRHAGAAAHILVLRRQLRPG